jgi:diguanylate cyclase (GGDEF)-like protein
MSRWIQKLGVKPALIGFVAIIVILSIEALLSWLYAQYVMNKDFEAEANSHLLSTAESMVLPVWDLDIDTLDRMAEALTQTSNVISVSLSDPSGIILTRHFNQNMGGDPSFEISRDIEAAYERNLARTATLKISYSRAQVQRELSHLAWKSLARMVISSVLFFGVLLITIRALILPIQSLERTVRKYDERQELLYVPGEKRENELGSLARGFKHMAAQIHHNVTTLESHVAKRTQELNIAIQDVVAANAKLEKAALHDPLTGLPNRLFVSTYLDEKIRNATDKENLIAVAHIDLDDFKKTNDTYGHSAGDFMLVEMASRMRNWVDDKRMIARVGGDEFLYIFTGCKSKAEIEDDIAKLLASLIKPLNFEGITLQSTASIGVSFFPTDGVDSDDLIVNADLALYEAKANGRGCIRFFEKTMREELDWQKTLEAEMVTALEKGHFMPYFQPQVNISTGEVTGVEMLVRWNHEARGLVSPMNFLPVAERAGLMVKLGRQVMEKAMMTAAEWQANDIEFGRLAFNMSAVELRELDHVDWLLGTAEKHGLSPNRLSVEILETVMINDERLNLIERLRSLRKAGVCIELDDFGTGYASLQQVNADEIDRIKIDRAFVENINLDKNKSAIVKAIVEMTHIMGVDVIAEGAETKGELETLLQFGCHAVQGYGIAPPMPAGVTGEWMDRFRRKSRRQKSGSPHILTRKISA